MALALKVFAAWREEDTYASTFKAFTVATITVDIKFYARSLVLVPRRPDILTGRIAGETYKSPSPMKLDEA